MRINDQRRITFFENRRKSPKARARFLHCNAGYSRHDSEDERRSCQAKGFHVSIFLSRKKRIDINIFPSSRLWANNNKGAINFKFLC